MLNLLAELNRLHLISELNYQFAKLIDRKQQPYDYPQQQRDLAILLAGLMSFSVMQGNSCLILETSLTKNPFALSGKYAELSDQILQKIGEISPLAYAEILHNHIAFSHDPSHIAPMLFQGNLLYFYRYWQAENQIAHYLASAANNENPPNIALHKHILDRFFPASAATSPTVEVDWQKIAVATALKQTFSIISGGPGTGKTRTVAILLAALQLKQAELGLAQLNIALTAPTGKAAARLKESIVSNLHALNLPNELDVPTQSSTIHSLIGITPYSDTPTYNARNPLHIDLIVVDEASMIDLFVMNKLLNALKPSTRVILLGDKDQLASVEAGNMMNELGKFLTLGYSPAHSEYLTATTGYPIYAQSEAPPAICDSLCHLRRSFRFDENSGIGNLSKEINAQQAVRSWQIFTNFSDLALLSYPASTEFTDQSTYRHYCVNLVVQYAVEQYRPYLQCVKQRIADPKTVSVEDIFNAFQKVRFLAALRVGDLGVENLNQRIAEALQQKGLVQFRHARESYLGKPILINENAFSQHLTNGDIGIILPDEQGKARVYFDSEQIGKPLTMSPSRLPAHDPAYVMTVHKSQGSEFEHTLLILPLQPAPIITKELLYTAVTRAKKTFTLFSNEKVWKQGVKSEVRRQSGLSDQLLALSSI